MKATSFWGAQVHTEAAGIGVAQDAPELGRLPGRPGHQLIRRAAGGSTSGSAQSPPATSPQK